MNIEETLAEVQKEGEIIPEESKETTPSESQPENEGADKKEEEENLPFHKHPRWKALNEEKEELKTRLEELERAKEETSVRPEEKTDLPEWWKNYYGDDDRSKGAYTEYVNQTKTFQDQVEERVLGAIEKREQDKVRLAEEADSYIESEIEELQQSEKFEKNELLKFMLDFEDKWGVPIVNDKGQYDFKKGLGMMKEYLGEEEPSDEKKKVSNLTNRPRTTAPSNKEKSIPSHILRRSGWNPPTE